MKVFVTGASGFIGTQVVRELLAAGHEVVALARSDASQAKLEEVSSKVSVLRGDLNDLDSLKKGAAESDGVIHLGFVHDFTRYEECCQIDRTATTTMLDVLKGTNRPFIYTSGVVNSKGKVAVETDERSAEEGNTRALTEKLAVSYKDKDVRALSVRLSPTVHGEGDHGFIPGLIGIARGKGYSAYIGEGSNPWPAVHVNDAAKVFVLALEKGKAGHAYHAVGEGSVKSKDIAEAIGSSINVPVKSIPQEKAMEHFGFLGIFFGLSVPHSNEITRKELGWEPTNPTLLEDIASDYYSKSSAKNL
ncbi:uncharacterized protein CLIB1423_11S01662 [[Candida] railenensis]|uniref:NAD-dependent epimerase/dehydratase domain-containing protein n=1 Tax=[Candida] railenensis TaxID=45579 RepID=A0A9P0QSE0_9ASCO|nr:uncharacterized protein CLIB1423_11S01662 [[Candida] railenensis]